VDQVKSMGFDAWGAVVSQLLRSAYGGSLGWQLGLVLSSIVQKGSKATLT
jgi:hypothetical protein